MAMPAHLLRLVTRLRTRWPSRSEGSSRATTLGDLSLLRAEIHSACQALIDFGRCSGEEFTTLAEKISLLDTGLSQVRTQTTVLDAILNERDEDQALASAFDVYKKSVDLVHSCLGIALSQEEQMEQMEIDLFKNRDRFTQNSVLFRMLVTSIRIEAARIDPENRVMFTGVAAEIETIERAMKTTFDGAFAQIETIFTEAGKGRSELRRIQGDLHSRAQRSVELLRNELNRIKLSLRPCLETSQAIAGLLDLTHTQTSELITSLQYQDIVRQQLEHVGQGFEDIAAHLDATPVDSGYLHQAARIQQKQLGAARASIDAAAATITGVSQQLLDTGNTLVERFVAMGKAADSIFQESCVGALFRAETENLVRVADLSESTNQRIARLVERIEESVKIFSTEISAHEFSVQIVALNAQIAASRVPNAGALNKLAEETSWLASQTAGITREVSAQLGETLERLNVIRQESNEIRHTLTREKDDLISGSGFVTDKLIRLNERIRHSAAEADRIFVEAYTQVHDFLPTLRFPSLIAPAYAPAESVCGRLLTATAHAAAAELGADGSERLASHRNRYTMREERTAHTAATVAAVAVGAAGDEETPECGGGVDLFDEPAEEKAPPAQDDGVELF